MYLGSLGNICRADGLDRIRLAEKSSARRFRLGRQNWAEDDDDDICKKKSRFALRLYKNQPK